MAKLVVYQARVSGYDGGTPLGLFSTYLRALKAVFAWRAERDWSSDIVTFAGFREGRYVFPVIFRFVGLATGDIHTGHHDTAYVTPVEVE